MKNKILSRIAGAAIMLFAFLMAVPSELKAQNICNGSAIYNLTGCPVKVSYRFVCLSTGLICSTGGPMTIVAGGTFPVPACACNPGPCALYVTVYSVGPNALTPAVTVSPTNPNGVFPAAFCAGSTGNITWYSGGVKIY